MATIGIGLVVFAIVLGVLLQVASVGRTNRYGTKEYSGVGSYALNGLLKVVASLSLIVGVTMACVGKF